MGSYQEKIWPFSQLCVLTLVAEIVTANMVTWKFCVYQQRWPIHHFCYSQFGKVMRVTAELTVLAFSHQQRGSFM